MTVLHTTVLVYAVGTEHPRRDPARALVALVRDGDLRTTTTVEVVQELAHVRARRRPRAGAAARAAGYVAGLSPLVRPEEEDLLEGLALCRDAGHLGPFDAVLAATARRRGWALAPADRSFREVDGLVHLDLWSGSFLDQALAAG